ncbi:MAG: DUF1573 domain-containing protein [Aureliella sp.]
MLRVLITLAVMAGVGYLAGSVQSSIETSGFTERFRDTRETQAEINSEVSREELLEQSSVGTPKVEVDGGTRYDFGSMMHGETMSHTFTFRNIGDGPLNLTMGSTTCKCTLSNLENAILEPGEETEIKLTWTARSLLSDFGQSATINTTDPSATEVKLVVSGKIVNSFVSEPAELTLGEIQSSEGVEQTLYLMNYLDDDTDVERLAWSDPRTNDFIEMSSEPVTLDGEFAEEFPEHRNCLQAHKIKLVIKPGLPIGPLNGKIEIGTDKGDNLEDIKVSVNARVAGEVTLMGGPSLDTKLNRLDFGSVKSVEGASLVVYLRVAPHLAKTFEPTVTVTQFEENLTASVGEPRHRSTSSLFPIRLEIPKGAPAVNLVGPRARNYCKVVVKTNTETAPEIPIYVRMVVTK